MNLKLYVFFTIQFLLITVFTEAQTILFEGNMGGKPIKVDLKYNDRPTTGVLHFVNTKEHFPFYDAIYRSEEFSFLTMQPKDDTGKIFIQHCYFELKATPENDYKGFANCSGEEFPVTLTQTSKAVLNNKNNLNVKIISANHLPAEIFRNNKISKSEIIKAYQYKDKLGFHYTFIAKKSPEFIKNLPHEMEDSQDIELYAQSFLYQEKTKNYSKEWQIYDLVNDCPLDISGDFFSEAFQITDVNQNNISEVWILYKLGCRGGVDPLDMKIMMYENGKKYAMRGEEKIIQSFNEKTKNYNYTGGKYTYDEAFLNSKDQKIIEFSKKLWNKYVFTPQD